MNDSTLQDFEQLFDAEMIKDPVGSAIHWATIIDGEFNSIEDLMGLKTYASIINKICTFYIKGIKGEVKPYVFESLRCFCGPISGHIQVCVYEEIASDKNIVLRYTLPIFFGYLSASVYHTSCLNKNGFLLRLQSLASSV